MRTDQDPILSGERARTAWRLIRFLDGSGQIDGVSFGERHPKEPGAFWWRKFLPSLLSADLRYPSAPPADLLAALTLIANAEHSALDLAYCKGVARAALANFERAASTPQPPAPPTNNP
jgi:hypothetical protein